MQLLNNLSVLTAAMNLICVVYSHGAEVKSLAHSLGFKISEHKTHHAGLAASRANLVANTAPPKVSAVGDAPTQYLQYVMYSKEGGCNSAPHAGNSFPLNTCFYAAEFSSNGTNVLPVYAYAFENGLGSVNITYFNQSGCAAGGPALDNQVAALSEPGCALDTVHPEAKYARTSLPGYPMWPTGAGYTVK